MENLLNYSSSRFQGRAQWTWLFGQEPVVFGNHLGLRHEWGQDIHQGQIRIPNYFFGVPCQSIHSWTCTCIPQRANPSALPPSFWDHIQGRSQSKPHLLIGSVSHKRFGEPETWGPSLASQGPSSKTAGTEALAGGEQWRGLGPHLEQDINTIERRTVHIAQLNTKDHTCDLNPQSLDFEEHEQGHWFSNLLGWTEVKYVRHSNKITKIIITNNLFELSFGPFRWELDGRMHVHAEHKKVCHHPWSLRCWRRHTGHRYWSKHSVHWGKSHTTSSIWPVLPTCCEPPTPLQLLPPRPWVPGLRISERAGWCLTAWFT